MSSLFKKRVLALTRDIPKGETRTYKDIATQAGNPEAARAVGDILNKNYDPEIPCHRVVRSDGTLGGYNRGADLKKQLLEKESQ
jgi:methylated-DNA-[protein]-cysteine S-methyltransferase